MDKLNLVGVDVGAESLVIRVIRQGQLLPDTYDFVNDTQGRKALVGFITKRGYGSQVCIEATGVYHMPLALLCASHKKVEVMVVNPRAIHHFSKAAMTRGKTDKVDALKIVQYLQSQPFTPWTPPPEKHLEIQALARRMQQLTEAMVQEKNRLHADEYKEDGTFILKQIEKHIEYLQQHVDKLLQRALKLVKEDQKLSTWLTRLDSIPGIAELSAVKLIAELLAMPQDMKPEQWVAHAGLDPKVTESGSSINKPRHISKAGNKYLRTALFMPAMVAIQRSPEVKAFYQKLIQAGKKPMRAIIAVMRKMLMCIWGMFKHNTLWQGSKFYAVKA